MLRNYLKIAFRNLRRHKLFSFINIAGLSIGIAGSLLILVYVAGQLSYESFQKNRDNIVRVSVRFGKGSGAMNFAGAMPPLGPAMVARIPQVTSAVRFKTDQRAKIKVGNRQFTEHNFFFADSTVFDVFTFPLLKGDKKTALDNPSSIVISQAIAQKFFGDANPIGRIITYNDKYDFIVSGVMKNVPRNAMLRPDLIAPWSREKEIHKTSLSWYSFGGTYTYLLLKKKTSLTSLHNDIRQLLEANTNKAFASMFHFTILRLTDIHFRSNAINELAPTTDLTSVYLFAFIAILVLIVACLNFINLSTAWSLRRAKEAGLRKVMGAQRKSLISQFFGESVLITVIAVLISLLIFELAHPLLNGYFNARLDINPFKTTYFYVILLGITLCVSLLSGIYPAVFLSKFQPVDSLRSAGTPGTSGTGLRKLLVVTQFAITVFLIIGTAIAYEQLNFMRNSDLGFEKQNVIIVNYPVKKKGMEQKYPVVRQAFRSIPGVTDVSGAYTLPGINSKQTEEIQQKGKPENEHSTLQAIGVDYDFIPTLGLKLIKGRNFSRKFSTDPNNAIILNEAAAKSLELKNPIGEEIYLPSNKGKNHRRLVTVIGVIWDFHVTSFHKKIAPMFLYINPGYFYHIALRINPRHTNEILASLQKKWSSILPGTSFNYSFLSRTYDSLYDSDAQSGRLFSIFSFLSIFIACMGLFGLISYTVEVRVKEIGIRKVLGASVQGIVALLSKDFLKLVAIGFLVAVPVAWYAMHRWLENFAYHVSIGVWTFVLAGALAMFIALITVSWQSIRAAMMNPAKSLRTE